MKRDDMEARVLMGQIDAGIKVMEDILTHLDDFIGSKVHGRKRDRIAAIVVADALSRYYTAAETVFVRIARFFENSLGESRWHADLLQRMSIAIPGVRPAAISRATMTSLSELLRFRHFSRYYVELEYDWERLSFLLMKLDAVRSALPSELKAFRAQLGATAKHAKGANGER